MNVCTPRPLAGDSRFQRRILAGSCVDVTGVSIARSLITTKLAAVGFCLGGIVALELARDRASIRCAVGFHPAFMRPIGSTTGPIAAKVLMMIGEDDPVVPPVDRTSFIQEMKEAGADWQLHVFGGVGHSYTNREIDARGMPGFAYNESADRRAWSLMLSLFGEVF